MIEPNDILFNAKMTLMKMTVTRIDINQNNINKMTLNKMTLIKMTSRKRTLSRMTFDRMTLSRWTFIIMTLPEWWKHYTMCGSASCHFTECRCTTKWKVKARIIQFRLRTNMSVSLWIFEKVLTIILRSFL